MSAMFESYEREYSELSHSIARQAGLVASLSGGALPSPPPAPPRAAPRPRESAGLREAGGGGG